MTIPFVVCKRYFFFYILTHFVFAKILNIFIHHRDYLFSNFWNQFRTEFSSYVITYFYMLHRFKLDLSKGDATADWHQGLKIFSTSIIRADALNTGIYIRRVYAHVQVSRVCVYASRVHSSTYRVPWIIDVCQEEQMISLLATTEIPPLNIEKEKYTWAFSQYILERIEFRSPLQNIL